MAFKLSNNCRSLEQDKISKKNNGSEIDASGGK